MAKICAAVDKQNGYLRGYLADLSRCQHSGHHGRAQRDSDHALDIYAGHRVPGTRAHAADSVRLQRSRNERY